jgi:hypothetical protein
MPMQVTLNAHPRYLIATDLIAFVLAAALVLLLTRIPMLLSPLAAALLVAALAALFGVEILVWFRHGIRSVEMDDASVTIFRGPGFFPRRIERGSIARIRIPRRPGRRVVIVKVSAGDRITIAEDAFPREAFARFLSAIGSWR